MKKIFVTTILAIVVAAGWFVFTLDNRIGRHIEETASILTGVPVTVGSVNLSLWNGEANLKNLVVDNPKGYSDNKAFELDSVFVKVDLSSVFSELLKINQVKIDSTKVNLEFQEDLSSNLEDILAVSDKQNGVSSLKKKKSKSSSKKKSDKVEDSGLATDETNQDATEDDKKLKDEDKPDSTYLFTIDSLLINNTEFSAVLKDDSWAGEVEAIDLNNLGKEEGMSTRALGIIVVRELTRKVLRKSASEKILNVVEDKVKEGVKLLESLFKKE